MPAQDPSLQELEDQLAGWVLRLRLRDALSWSLRGLAAGLAVALFLSLVAWLRPWQPVPVLAGLSLGLALAGLGLAMALAFFWPRSKLAGARYFDRVFGLAERTSTALETAAAGAGSPAWLLRDQWSDAAAAARRVNPRRDLPFFVRRRDAVVLLAVAGALALSLYLPNPQQAILAHQQAVDQAIAEQIKEIEEARDAIENNPNLTEEQRAELVKPLDDAQAQLQQGGLTQEQAVQILTETQQKLDQLADPNSQAQAQALQDAAQTLSQNPQTQDAAQALASGDIQQAASDLANIDPGQLTEAERQALADTLEQAAQQLATSNPAVAEQLQAAADALRAGDVAAAQAALAAASQAMAQTAQAAAQADAAGQASDAVATAQQVVAQAGNTGQGQGQGQGNGQGQGQGQGDGQGQGQGDGQGQGQGQGDGQGSSGSGSGDGTGNTQGGGSGTDPIGQGNQSDGGERTYEEIYTPYHVGGTDGQDVTVDGSGDGSGEVVGEGPSDTSETGNVTVGYDQVYSGYADQAYAAVDSGEYPDSLKDVVKNYFTSLQP
jgi:hypothetical protein